MQHVLRVVLRRRFVRFVITGGSAAALFATLSFGALSLGAPPFAGTLAA